MKLERGGLIVEVLDFENPPLVAVGLALGGEMAQDAHVTLDPDEARWLLTTALPAAIVEVDSLPSEPPVKVRDASNDEGQIEGQLAID